MHPLQRLIKSYFCAFIAISLNPKFCGDKQFFSRNTTSFDSSTNRFFVQVRSGSVDMAISRLNSVNYASFTFGWISYLKNTEAKCVIRSKATTDSGVSRPLNPEYVDHRFQCKPSAFQG